MLYVMQQHQVVGQPQLEIQQLMSEQGMPLLETRVCRHSKSFGEGNPHFRGNLSLEETQDWLSAVDHIMGTIHCTEDDKKESRITTRSN
jgi:hypothetical protein